MKALGLPGPTDSIIKLAKFVASKHNKSYSKVEGSGGMRRDVRIWDQEYGASRLTLAFQKGKLGKIMLDCPEHDHINSPFAVKHY